MRNMNLYLEVLGRHRNGHLSPLPKRDAAARWRRRPPEGWKNQRIKQQLKAVRDLRQRIFAELDGAA